MVTTQKKLEVCKKNDKYLKIIWLIGEGLMFRSQLQEFVEKFYKEDKYTVMRVIQELRENDILETIPFEWAVLLKLKKYALRYLLRVDREKIASISVNNAKMLKTAYRTTLILNLYKDADITLEELVEHLNSNTNFYIKEREGYNFLKAFRPYFSVKTGKEINVDYQIHALIKNNMKSKLNLPYYKNNTDEEIEILENEELELKRFNANSLYKHNMLVVNTDFKVLVYILDVHENLTPSKFLDLVKEGFNYLDDLFNNREFIFIACVSNQVRYDEVKPNRKKVDDWLYKYRLDSWYDSKAFGFKVKNMEISKHFLANQLATYSTAKHKKNNSGEIIITPFKSK